MFVERFSNIKVSNPAKKSNSNHAGGAYVKFEPEGSQEREDQEGNQERTAQQHGHEDDRTLP